MPDGLIFNNSTAPSAPASGKLNVYGDTSNKSLAVRDDTGKVLTLPGIRNFNTSDVVATSVNTYLTGSQIIVPPHLLQAGTIFKWRIFMSKSAAGIAAPIWTIKCGILGTVVDATLCTFTGPAQTAVVDQGFVEITAILRNTGAAGVLAGGLTLSHNLAATGFANIGSPVLLSTSAGFNTTTAGLMFGIAVNPGASGVWTHQIVKAEAWNL